MSPGTTHGRSPALPWSDHDAMQAAVAADPDGFWLDAARRLDWHRSPREAFRTDRDGHATWFGDGMLNTSFNALDRHVRAGAGGRPALVVDGALDGGTVRLTYAELLDRVARFAGGLRRLGVVAGDRVLITMPTGVEAVVAMLAAARIGAPHVFVFAGFAPAELARRIDATRPRVLVGASALARHGRPVPQDDVIDRALALSRHAPAHRVVLRRRCAPGERRAGLALDYAALLDATPADAVPVPSAHPLYVLHTSGTTGRPKGVVRDTGGHATALALSMPLIYGAAPGDAFCTTADLGWVVGHSYGVYGPLLAGCTAVLLEGDAGGAGAPDALWRLLARERVRTVLTAPTVLRAMRARDPDATGARRHDLGSLDAVFVAGERADAATLDWAGRATGAAVLDHWWQTETGWSIAGGFRGFGEHHRATDGIGRASPGVTLAVLDEVGRPVVAGGVGEIALALPLPPGAFATVEGDGQGFRETCLRSFPGFYRTGDVGTLAPDGLVRLLARQDDVLKIAGRRIAGGLLEDAIADHPAIAECAVVARPDALRGSVPVAFVVLAAGADPDPGRLRAALDRRLGERIGRFVRLRDLRCVDALPKTRSGKIMRDRLRTLVSAPAGSGASPPGEKLAAD